ncbi:serine hydrolase domain-containing protein [Piscinibacter gummiphilus]|uniref:Serine hydrolase domain-containing protein n=1 Tax=Piscinibacter gummiphilus TaxID=946333 RepID=A0ABZ0CRJ3_9BURK|nr:serine hydrolase domain-containing protein [Piscinibacter gummiphilus]WOB07612.1 serine hydrolase domain-containing protein [Piscinibacter gummiphilus]
MTISHSTLRRTLLATFATSAMLVAGCATPGASDGGKTPGTMNAAALQKLDELVTRDAAAGRLPGAVIVLYRDGKVVHERAIGVRNPQASSPMTADSIFRIYSMSKPIVSVGTMMLVEDGKVQLQAPISRYLPEFKDLKLGVEKKDASGNPVLELVPSPRQPTVQDLVRHTSGLTYGVFGKSLVKSEYLKAGVEGVNLSNTEFAKRIATMPLAYVPGTTWEYSRSTDVLGALIERVSGQTLGAYLQQRILGPLGMKDSGFHVPADKLGRIAEPYKVDPDSKQPVNLIDITKPPVYESGGGGMVSTAADYLRFCRMMLNGGELDGVRILSPKTVASMMSDHLGEDVIRTSRIPGTTTGYLPGPGYGFGLGFAVRLAPGESASASSVGESNWGGFGGTAFWIDPKEKLIAIWMMQAPGQREHYRAVFRNMVYGAF